VPGASSDLSDRFVLKKAPFLAGFAQNLSSVPPNRYFPDPHRDRNNLVAQAL
jgi:hypothetical protein